MPSLPIDVTELSIPIGMLRPFASLYVRLQGVLREGRRVGLERNEPSQTVAR
jgi:hypothetical protein